MNKNAQFKIEHIEEFDNLLKDIISTYGTKGGRLTYKGKQLVTSNVRLMNYITDNTPMLADVSYDIYTKIYWILHDVIEFPKCEVCGKTITRNIKSLIAGYSPVATTSKEVIPLICCSNQCTQRHPLMAKHRCNSCQQKYGVDNVFQLESIKIKSANTLFQKTGYFHNTSDPKVKRKREESYFKKTGYKNPGENPEVKEKMRKTSVLHFGVANANQNKEHVKQMTIENGRRSIERMLKFDRYCIPLFDEYEYSRQKQIPGHCFQFKCKICGREFESVFTYEVENIKRPHATGRCPYCFPNRRSSSYAEKELFSFCKTICEELGVKIKRNDKTMLRCGRRCLDIDISIPELGLLIEYDGYYYHSEEYYKQRISDRPTLYAWKKMDKTQLAEQSNLRLLHIDEWDWIHDKQKMLQLVEDTIRGIRWYNPNDELIVVNRNFHNTVDKPTGFNLIGETGPVTSVCRHLHVENCGYLFYMKDIKYLT